MYLYTVCALIYHTVYILQKWIGNYKRVKKVLNNQAEESSSKTIKKAKAARGPSSFNLFCSDFFRCGKIISYILISILL